MNQEIDENGSGAYIVSLKNTELISVNANDPRRAETAIKVNKDNYKVGICKEFKQRRKQYYKTFWEENVVFEMLYQTDDYLKLEKIMLEELSNYRMRGRTNLPNEWLEGITYSQVIQKVKNAISKFES